MKFEVINYQICVLVYEVVYVCVFNANVSLFDNGVPDGQFRVEGKTGSSFHFD